VNTSAGPQRRFCVHPVRFATFLVMVFAVALSVGLPAQAARKADLRRAGHSASALARVCPTHPLALSASAVASAARVVLAHQRKTLRPIVESASLASVDRERGGQVRTLCGAADQRRTVIVYLRDRALGRDESLAQAVFFVSRFPSGYRAWYAQ
jgi:hypothetical protein